MRLHPNDWGVLALAGGLAVLLGGCPANDGRDMRLLPDVRTQGTDVPVPEGFSLVDEASEDRSTGTARLYVRHVYRGKADKYLVRKFYHEEMPLARWSLVSDSNVRGHITMRFEKASESCELEIQQVPRGLGKATQLQIIVSQEQRGSATGDASAGVGDGS